MAESVEISEDELTYTFTLRDGIKWSNGDPVTSQDFKFAWLRALDPDTAGQYAYIISTFVEGANEFNTGDGSAEDVAIDALDDKTLEVKLVSSGAVLAGSHGVPNLPAAEPEFVEEQGDDYAQSAGRAPLQRPLHPDQLQPDPGRHLRQE